MVKEVSELQAYIEELLEPIGALEFKPFFGGKSLRCRDVQIGMLMGDVFHLSVEGDLRTELKAHGGKPFSYMTKNGERIIEKYCAVPADILDDQDALISWVNRTIQSK
jgi:TfoX/Sxy family transcriptional regulator of competence genes